MREQVQDTNLRLMVFNSAEELGQKVDEHLLEMYGLDKDKYTFIVPITETFFSDGHLKSVINETVRGKDIFAITDIGNYSLTYDMHGFTNHTSPNDLIIQLLDGIGACNCHADKLNVIMPLLYAGRQHRRNGRENLLCGMMLHIFDSINRMRSLITFDAHDQSVEHAVHNMEFDNVPPNNCILERFIDDLSCDELKKIVFIAPDNGATGRRNVYLNSFNCVEYIYREAGSFVKLRDYNHVIDGKNPILSHDYCGNDNLEGFTAIISDDMISSGGSMCDVIEELHKRNVKHIYVITTFALFTEGIERFGEYYEKGMLDGVYTTNLSYIPEEFQKNEWLHVCDCSKLIAQVVFNIHNNLSLSSILGDRSYPISLLEEKFKNAPQTLSRRKPE
ncbi:MAG: ribose-phosphate diphosphokinase [Ruminococcus sp.]|nr:ribose-phosphate diphosphokinase [Ruminococcus sp.]